MSHPGAEEASKTHPRCGSFRATGASTDLAGDNQRAHTALGQIVVSGNPRERDKDKQLWQKTLDALTQRVLRSLSVGVGVAEAAELLLEGVLLRHAKSSLLAWRQREVRPMLSPGNSLIIDGFDAPGPGHQGRVTWILLLEVMHIA